MALGGLHKGNNGGNRGKSYGLMLLLAFGAALLGVMVIHKLRERRIFNLLAQEKDHELTSLQLLLQKERDYSKEMKRKTEELNAKLISLYDQKTELDSRLLEMQSTIESIKDEQKILETTLDEKQNELKWLRKKDVDSGKEDHQLVTLKESLKQKEAEIEDLKRLLELPVKVWSVSSDDPSKPLVNLTETGYLSQKNENLTRGTESLNISIDAREGLNASGNVAKMDNRAVTNDKKRTIGERIQNTQTLRSKDGKGGGATEGENGKDLQGKENENPQEGKASGIRKVNDASNAEVTGNNGKNVDKSTNEEGGMKSTEDKELKTTEAGYQGELAKSHEGGMKVEVPDNLRRSRDSSVKGRHRLLTRSKGKRWRMIAKTRTPDGDVHSRNNGVVNVRSSKSSPEVPHEHRRSEERAASLEVKTDNERRLAGQATPLGGKETHAISVKLLDTPGGKDGSHLTVAYTNEEEDMNFQMPGKLDLASRTIDAEAFNSTNDVAIHKKHNGGQSEEQENKSFQGVIETEDFNKIGGKGKETEPAEKYKVTEDSMV